MRDGAEGEKKEKRTRRRGFFEFAEKKVRGEECALQKGYRSLKEEEKKKRRVSNLGGSPSWGKNYPHNEMLIREEDCVFAL